jgi:hypothetical protein
MPMEAPELAWTRFQAAIASDQVQTYRAAGSDPRLCLVVRITHFERSAQRYHALAGLRMLPARDQVASSFHLKPKHEPRSGGLLSTQT